VLSGAKTFEVRRNDRAYQKGDTLILIDTSSCDCGSDRCDKRRPPIRVRVTFVYAGDPGLRDLGGIVPGHVVLGLGIESFAESLARESIEAFEAQKTESTEPESM
jgi:hypothetical protein